MRRRIDRFRWILPAVLMLASCSQPEPYGPVPTEAQLEWQRMEINMFCHFGSNTFSGVEWGSGSESAAIFQPRRMDCNQWVEVASKAGMSGIVLTAKHHDGFCLWPSAYSYHTVAQSQWQGGQGDVLAMLRSAIDGHNSTLGQQERAMKMGVYLSPWDRNHPTYGTSAYNDVFSNMLHEVHQAYGPLFEQWFDGACGEGPNGKRQAYDWPRFEATVKNDNPACVIFSDVGPDCRWVGNEEGWAGITNWSTLTVDSGQRSTPYGASGVEYGQQWIPAEVDVSLRPGWFWHAGEVPKSVNELMEIYFNSVGRNGLLLLNVPPDTSGRICREDSLRLMEFRAERDRLFDTDLAEGGKARARHSYGSRYRSQHVLDSAYHTYWIARDTVASLWLSLRRETQFDMIVLQEYIPLGQRVKGVELYYQEQDGHWRPAMAEDAWVCTTVGYKRIVRLPFPLQARNLRFQFHADAPPIINRIAIYNTTI